MAPQMTRMAIVDEDRCRPKKCRQECYKACIIVKTGKLCIEVNPASKLAFISEELCIGCGICVKNPPDWQEILKYFRGSELQNYFKRILEENLKAIIKPQYVDHIPKAVQGNVGQVLEQKDERNMKTELCIDLELNQVIDRNVGELSGGELQKFAIAAVSIQNAQIYMFDEPSTYLDVKQRLKAAKVIRSLLRPSSYVIIVEHDLSILDYLSDFICCLYGTPGVYGVVTMPFSVREGINIFLAGFVPTENLRFRNESLTFKIPETEERAQETETYQRYKYPTMSKSLGNFKLNVVEGEFTDCQIVVMFGENGTGKTTFIKMLTDTNTLSYCVAHYYVARTLA
ncbi:hypothetical protein PR202_ga12391 [Eleusine coracana subsp. coracana]|uniref:Uncharacterized protein n=1 Tax=Eleusine coracana subsp. coracana TaxID=191504 RepID=A0AAV5CBI7_ELECO|nr:hypothetical protein PR202_ga12391 [Eleusine coracana subsp. coracana]